MIEAPPLLVEGDADGSQHLLDLAGQRGIARRGVDDLEEGARESPEVVDGPRRAHGRHPGARADTSARRRPRPRAGAEARARSRPRPRCRHCAGSRSSGCRARRRTRAWWARRGAPSWFHPWRRWSLPLPQPTPRARPGGPSAPMQLNVNEKCPLIANAVPALKSRQARDSLHRFSNSAGRTPAPAPSREIM